MRARRLRPLVPLAFVLGCSDCEEPVIPPPPDASELVSLPSGEGAEVSLKNGVAVRFGAVVDPGVPSGTELTTLQLFERTEPPSLGGLGLELAGPIFELELAVPDPTAFASAANGGVGRLDAVSFLPSIVIPKALLGAADDEVIALVRVGPMARDGVVDPAAVRVLPALRDDDGNILVTDYYFPHSLLGALEAEAASASPGGLTASQKIGVRYAPATALAAVNWAKDPKLVRMIPSAAAPHRAPLSELAARDASAAAIERDRCVRNLVVLVHGHNEAEGRGFSPPTIAAPWEVEYKRDVWTLLYRHLASHDPKHRLDCTAFFELIYPTYRPILTPHGSRQRLDEAFAALLSQELAPYLASGNDYRLFVVAHSMGGPVSRAGVQLMAEPLHRWLDKLVTWGSPHLGSPLPSIGFALAAAPPYVIHSPPGWRAGSLNVSNADAIYELLIELSGQLQVPAPGPRDYRWAGSTVNPARHQMTLDNIFDLSAAQLATPKLSARFDLASGPWVHSDNLKQLNDQDRYIHSSKYVGLYGATTKRPTWKQTLWGYLSYPDPSSTTQTGFGAYALEQVLDSVPNFFLTLDKNESDGAVPLESMIGSGVFGLANLYYLGDVDHEEYYGAPDAAGTFTQPTKAELTAETTRTALGFLDDALDCPSLTFDLEPRASYGAGETISVSGRLVWAGEAKPGARVREVALLGRFGGGSSIGTIGDDGAFAGQLASDLIPEDGDTLALELRMKDGSKLSRTWTVSRTSGGLGFTKLKVFVEYDSPIYRANELSYGGHEICAGPNDAGYVYFPTEQGKRFSGSWSGTVFTGAASAGLGGGGAGTVRVTMSADFGAATSVELDYAGGSSDLRGFRDVSGHLVLRDIPVESFTPGFMAELRREGAAGIEALSYAVQCTYSEERYELDPARSRGASVLLRFED